MPHRIYNKPWAPLAAFLILGIAGVTGFHISEKNSQNTLYQNSLQACERGNILRQQINDRLVVLQTQKNVLVKFIGTAYDARAAAAKLAGPGDTIDREAAKAYKGYIDALNETPALETVDLVNCEVAIEKP